MAVNRLNVGATNQLLAKASSGQSTNILELQNTAGVTVAGVDASGNPVGGLTAPTAAGKNKIINGDFGIWQRGTSFTNNANSTFNVDRFKQFYDGTGATRILSQQTFTPGSAPVAPYEAQYFLRFNQTVAGTTGTFNTLSQPIEDVRTFAGTTVTLSYWAKAAALLSLTIEADQFFGGGGSSGTTTSFVSGQTITTSWVRYTHTVTLPSVSGKTIGTNSALILSFKLPLNTTFTFDIWGVQLEAGSVATPFVPAGGGSVGAELALCQRYYYLHASGSGKTIGIGFNASATAYFAGIHFPVTMRDTPNLVSTTGTDYYSMDRNGATDSVNSLTIQRASTTATTVFNDTQVSGTSGQAGYVYSNNASASVAFSAEL